MLNTLRRPVFLWTGSTRIGNNLDKFAARPVPFPTQTDRLVSTRANTKRKTRSKHPRHGMTAVPISTGPGNEGKQRSVVIKEERRAATPRTGTRSKPDLSLLHTTPLTMRHGSSTISLPVGGGKLTSRDIIIREDQVRDDPPFHSWRRVSSLMQLQQASATTTIKNSHNKKKNGATNGQGLFLLACKACEAPMYNLQCLDTVATGTLGWLVLRPGAAAANTMPDGLAGALTVHIHGTGMGSAAYRVDPRDLVERDRHTSADTLNLASRQINRLKNTDALAKPAQATNSFIPTARVKLAAACSGCGAYLGRVFADSRASSSCGVWLTGHQASTTKGQKSSPGRGLNAAGAGVSVCRHVINPSAVLLKKK